MIKLAIVFVPLCVLTIHLAVSLLEYLLVK